MMKLIIPFATFLAFTATFPAYAVQTSTDRFIVAVADSLEAKVIGDDELATLMESADAGKLANPICEATAELSTERLLAYEVFKGYIDDGDLDAAAIAAWARENLADNERGRKRRDASRKETTLPWKIETRSTFSLSKTHGCAIDVKGDPVCWGRVRYPLPQGIGHLIHIGVDESGGGCATNQDGQGLCAGVFDYEVPQNRELFSSISPGHNGRFCALMKNGTVGCWGTRIKIPELESLGVAETVVVHGFHGCAIKKDGFVVCWKAIDSEITLTPPTDLGPVQSLSVGYKRACAVNANRFVVCWGNDHLGNNNIPKDLGEVLSVSCGWSHTCVVKSDHTVACWGWSKKDATSVPNELGPVDSVFASKQYTCAVKLDGTVVCWGESEDGAQAHIPPPGLIVKSSGIKP